MREAIALIIVILMGAFAATQAQWATPYALQAQNTMTQRVIQHIDIQEKNGDVQNWTPTIENLLTAWKKHQDNPGVEQSLATIVNYLMDLQENSENAWRTPTYKTL